ncbi:MAG: hypothetical protein ACFB2Z_03170 [Maricaulaceae bacterium]
MTVGRIFHTSQAAWRCALVCCALVGPSVAAAAQSVSVERPPAEAASSAEPPSSSAEPASDPPADPLEVTINPRPHDAAAALRAAERRAAQRQARIDAARARGDRCRRIPRTEEIECEGEDPSLRTVAVRQEIRDQVVIVESRFPNAIDRNTSISSPLGGIHQGGVPVLNPDARDPAFGD